VLVHIGQHYDEKMSGLFFRELGIAEPDINMEIGPGSHAVQTAAIMKTFEPVVIEQEQPTKEFEFTKTLLQKLLDTGPDICGHSVLSRRKCT